MTSPAFWLSVIALLLRRPALWLTALRQLGRLSAAGWWRRPPFLPLPDPGYLRFRLETQYGSDRSPVATDVITYLDWCRQFAQVR